MHHLQRSAMHGGTEKLEVDYEFVGKTGGKIGCKRSAQHVVELRWYTQIFKVNDVLVKCERLHKALCVASDICYSLMRREDRSIRKVAKRLASDDLFAPKMTPHHCSSLF